MKKIWRRLGILVLSTLVISTTCAFTNVNASTASTLPSSVALMTKNAASLYMGWNKISVVDFQKLYDFSGKQIAYSVDINNVGTGEHGYVILSSISNDEPIVQFSKSNYSAFRNTLSSNDTCVFDGEFGFYAKSSDPQKAYYTIPDKKVVPSDVVASLVDGAKSHNYQSINPTESNRIRSKLESKEFTTKSSTTAQGQIIPMSTTYNTLTGVPSYDWYLGCAPTSAAMVMEYMFYYQTPSPDECIRLLANDMETDSSGNTYIQKIWQGMNLAMEYYGINGYQSTGTLFGRLDATFDAVKNEINNGRPLVTSFIGSSISTSGYPNGFGDHSTCGIGWWQYTGDSPYLIVYDTDVADGEVWINYNSSMMGTPYWTYVDPA